MAAKLKYHFSTSGIAPTNYGIITTIPTLVKKTITLSGTISCNVSGSSLEPVSITATLFYKLNNRTETSLVTVTGSTSVTKNFSVSLDLSSATKLAFKFEGMCSNGRTGSFTADIYIDGGNVASTESAISASWVTNVKNFLGVSASASAGSVIKRAPYVTIASAVGASAPNSTSPKATDLSAIVSAINSTEVTKSWNSTSSSDY